MKYINEILVQGIQINKFDFILVGIPKFLGKFGKESSESVEKKIVMHLI